MTINTCLCATYPVISVHWRLSVPKPVCSMNSISHSSEKLSPNHRWSKSPFECIHGKGITGQHTISNLLGNNRMTTRLSLMHDGILWLPQSLCIVLARNFVQATVDARRVYSGVATWVVAVVTVANLICVLFYCIGGVKDFESVFGWVWDWVHTVHWFVNANYRVCGT